MSMPEERWVPLSAVSHYSFCPRRCALVHIERLWSDNYFTARGNELHVKVDTGASEARGDVRFARSLRLQSAELGVSGIADVVEFHRDDAAGCSIRGWQGRWLPYPVEYKWGSARNERPYELQLCAQAICLEEVFKVRIPDGALFLGVARHRRPVVLDAELRDDTRRVCSAIHAMIDDGALPPANVTSGCKSCSLAELCMPKLQTRSAREWLERQMV